MPFVYNDVGALDKEPPPPPAVGDGSCVVNGRYPNNSHGNHAAIVLKVMKSGIWVVDQWKAKEGISARLISIPPPRQQYNQDGSFRNPSDNALTFYVIER